MIIYMNPTLALIIFVIGLLISILILKVLLPKFFSWGQKLQNLGVKLVKTYYRFSHSRNSTWEKKKNL